jgi:hypothetical protein
MNEISPDQMQGCRALPFCTWWSSCTEVSAPCLSPYLISRWKRGLGSPVERNHEGVKVRPFPPFRGLCWRMENYLRELEHDGSPPYGGTNTKASRVDSGFSPRTYYQVLYENIVPLTVPYSTFRNLLYTCCNCRKHAPPPPLLLGFPVGIPR